MIIIVDGYNVLKLLHGADCSEVQRSAWINMLGRYIKKRNHKIIVVFDAGPTIYTSQEIQKGVTVLYSGKYKSADDIIVEYAAAHHQKEMLVVTADRELINGISAAGVQAIEPLLFYHKVKDVLTTHEHVGVVKDVQIIKFETDEENSELDALMCEAASMAFERKEEDFLVQYDGKKVKQDVSKKDRAWLKTWNKL